MDTIANLLLAFVFFCIGVILFAVLMGVLGYIFILWYRNRHREHESLHSVMLQITIAKENEIKIDAAEQLFASFAALEKHGMFHFLHTQPHLSFEIVGTPGEIRFYIVVPKHLQDLVEKQINGAYPDADIKPIDPTKVQKKRICRGG